jgi:hypothetical protein
MNTTFIIALLTFQSLFQGLYIPSIDTSWDVITPPLNGYVSAYPGVATIYDPGTGAEVLLIHNYLGGDKLMDVQIGDLLVYRTVVYQISGRIEFPAYQIPVTVYPNGHLILQTCIEKNGDGAWGRLLLWAVEVDT